MGELIKMQHRTTDLSHRHVTSPSDTEVVKVHYSSRSLNTLDTVEGDTLVSNSNRTVYNKGTGRIFVKHLRARNVELIDKIGGEKIMSDQLDRQQVQGMLEKELKSYNEKVELKFEVLSREFKSGIQHVESTLSQKIDSMNSVLNQGIQDLKHTNDLIKKDIEKNAITNQAAIKDNHHEIKAFILSEREERRLERKNDRKFIITTFIATIAGALTLAKLFL